MSPNLLNIPIYAVMVENLGERGAQYTALKLLQDVHYRLLKANTAAAVAAQATHNSANSANTAKAAAVSNTSNNKCEKVNVCGSNQNTMLAFVAAVAAITLGGFVFTNSRKN